MADNFLPDEDIKKMNEGMGQNNDDNLKKHMYTLSTSINSLIQIFKEASNDLKMDTHDAVLVSQKIDKLIDRIEKIEKQNEKIAKGIVAVADMIEELHSEEEVYHEEEEDMLRKQPRYTQSRTSSQPRPLPSYPAPQQQQRKSFLDNFKS